MSEDCIVANRTINNLLCRYNLYFITAPVKKYKSVHAYKRAYVRACVYSQFIVNFVVKNFILRLYICMLTSLRKY